MSLRLLAATLLLLLPRAGLAKEYHFASTAIEARLAADGSMRVREQREYVFSGEFHRAYRDLVLPPGTSLATVLVAEPGRPYSRIAPGDDEPAGCYRVSGDTGRVHLVWYYLARDETRTFIVEYEVRAVVQKHADVGELYWQFIGREWTVASQAVSVVVHLPAADCDMSQVRVWGHGPLSGVVEKHPGRVEYRLSDLPPGEMVEARITFPTDWLGSSPRQDFAAALPGILAEERKWAGEANRQRWMARYLWLGLLLAIATGVAMWLLLYVRFGREYHEDAPPEYLREPPEGWTPQEVAYLWKWGELSPSDATASLMELVRRGALRLEVAREAKSWLGGLLGTDTETYAILRQPGFKGELTPSERYLTDNILFGGPNSGDAVTMDALKQWGRRKPTEMRARLRTWRKLAKQEYRHSPVVDPDSRVAAVFGGGVGMVMAAAGFLGMVRTENPVFLLLGLVGLVLLVLSPQIRRRNALAACDLHRWQAFRRYLCDFTALPEYPPPALVLWEQFLVYAVALGVAAEVIKQFQELYPVAAAADPSFRLFGNWGGDAGSSLGAFDSFSTAFEAVTSSFAAAVSPASSGSGGGGGFSGGGGGGGGGGAS